MRSQWTKKNLASMFTDWAILSSLVFILFLKTSLLVWGHFLLPLLLTPVFRYITSAVFGLSPGLFLLRIQFVHIQTKAPIKRLFDWIFESELHSLDALPVAPFVTQFLIPLLLTANIGFQSFRIGSQDPAIMAYPTWSPPLFAPDPGDMNWNPLAFYYASGAWPNRYQGHPVLYSLPYEKGPPERFVGKIQIFWELPGAKITLLGPLTLGEPRDVQTLKSCFQKKWNCIGLRRSMLSRQLKVFFDKAVLKNAAWFEVNNPALTDDQKTQGIYYSGPAQNGQGWVEAYYLLNAKMALQGILLERSNDAMGVQASETLKKVVGSQRMETDLLAPKTWVNSQIAKIKLTNKSSTEELLQAQAFLLSKVSVDPKVFESFYHLGGISMNLFEKAKATHVGELTSTSKQTILSTFQFGEDIDPKNPKLKELELFKAQLKKAP
jgi:hypothetical protein